MEVFLSSTNQGRTTMNKLQDRFLSKLTDTFKDTDALQREYPNLITGEMNNNARINGHDIPTNPWTKEHHIDTESRRQMIQRGEEVPAMGRNGDGKWYFESNYPFDYIKSLMTYGVVDEYPTDYEALILRDTFQEVFGHAATNPRYVLSSESREMKEDGNRMNNLLDTNKYIIEDRQRIEQDKNKQFDAGIKWIFSSNIRFMNDFIWNTRLPEAYDPNKDIINQKATVSGNAVSKINRANIHYTFREEGFLAKVFDFERHDYDMQSFARGNACKRNFPIPLPQPSQIP